MLSILSSKKKWLTKEKKAGILKKFIEATNEYSVGADQEFYNLVLKEVKLSGRSTSSQRSKWTHAYMGEKLTVLYLLHDNFLATTNKTDDESSRRATRGGTGAFFKGLHSEIKEVLHQAATDEAVQAARATRTSLNLQASGIRFQDRTPFNASKVDLEPCPVCNHMCTMAVQSLREVEDFNSEALQEHNRKLAAWEQVPPNQRVAPKPRAPTTTSEQIACYCVKNHCLLALDGGQCYHCKEFACECARIGTTFLQEDASGKLTCPCAICACSCQIVFKQHERSKIGLAQALQTAGLPSVEERSTVGFFHGIIDSHLKNGSVSALQESGISEEQASNDAASFASLGILADPNIQSNTLLRKNLQAACGPRPRITKDGVSIDVLRLRQGTSSASRGDVRNPPPTTSNWAMPPPRPLNAAVASRDSRFFRNKLTGTPVERASNLTNCKKSRYIPLPTSTTQSVRNTVDLLSPLARAPTIDILDNDDASIASMESLSIEDGSVKKRKTRMRLNFRKKVTNEKKGWTDGQPTEEQQKAMSSLKACHSCLTYETPRKSVDTTIRDSILAGETTPQAMDFLMLEKME